MQKRIYDNERHGFRYTQVELRLTEDFGDFFGEDLEHTNAMVLLGMGDIGEFTQGLIRLEQWIRANHNVDGKIGIYLDDSVRDEQDFKFGFSEPPIPLSEVRNDNAKIR